MDSEDCKTILATVADRMIPELATQIGRGLSPLERDAAAWTGRSLWKRVDKRTANGTTTRRFELELDSIKLTGVVTITGTLIVTNIMAEDKKLAVHDQGDLPDPLTMRFSDE